MDNYSDVGDEDPSEAVGVFRYIFSVAEQVTNLLLARRHPLLALHPLNERGLGVADGPRRARMRGDGPPYIQKPGGFLWGEQDDPRRGWLLRIRAAGERRRVTLRNAFRDYESRSAGSRSQ